jgi:excisionase family DNA binding protein
MIKNKNYLTSLQAAKILGVTPDYIRLLIGKDKLKATKLGHNWLIRPSALAKIKRKRFGTKKEIKSDGSD